MRKLKSAAALGYEQGKDSAPKVIASGRGHVAEKIIKIANDNDIPLFEDELTANVLCSLPLNSEIPDSLYQTIAEIYAFILQMEAKGSRGRQNV